MAVAVLPGAAHGVWSEQLSARNADLLSRRPRPEVGRKVLRRLPMNGVMKAGGERRFDCGLGVAAVVSAYGLVFVAWTAFHWGGDSARTTVVDVAFTPVNLVGALLAWRAARRLAGDPRRRAWLL